MQAPMKWNESEKLQVMHAERKLTVHVSYHIDLDVDLGQYIHNNVWKIIVKYVENLNTDELGNLKYSFASLIQNT